MARRKDAQPAIDKSDLVKYPFGRIQDDVTPVNEFIYGDIHEFFGKLIRLAGISANGLPDNETNGYQLIDAAVALPSKNDYLKDISSDGTRLTIALKLGVMKVNETLFCKATVDKGAHTEIKGSDNTVKPVSYLGDFKNGEFVQLINTAVNVIILRLPTAINLNTMVSELLFLKAASNAQEQAGSSNSVATTPQSNALAFTERVNGSLSAASLATALRNGLYPKEHFAIVANLGADRVRNIGWFAGVDINSGSVSQSYPTNGDVAAAQRISRDNGETYEITIANAMTGTNYYVRHFLQSQSSSMGLDNDIKTIVFKPISTTKFHLFIQEETGHDQSLKIHLEVVQI